MTLNLRSLAQLAYDSRETFVAKGHNRDDCWIGRHVADNQVRLASNDGAIDYRFNEDGTIARQSIGCTTQLMVFVDGDLAEAITNHNQAARAANRNRKLVTA